MATYGFWKIAQDNPGHVALIEPDGRKHTAGELLGEANRVVHGLRALGLKHGDTLAVMLTNEAAMLQVYLAATQAGFYITPINSHLTAPEVAYIVQDCDAKALFCSARTVDVGRQAAATLGFPENARFSTVKAEGFRDFADLKKDQPTTLPSARRAGASMTYTSGTTGQPKGVRRPLPDLDPETVAERNALFLQLFGITPHDAGVHLVVSPLYHTAVLNFCTNHLHFGHTIVLMDKWTPEGTLDLIARHRVTTSHMVPTQFKRLLSLPDAVRAKADTSSLRHMIHSAAPCPVDVKKQMITWWGNVIFEYYAASEGGGTMVAPQEWMKKPGTVGKAWPISEIAIFDDEGNRIEEPDVIGTVYMSMQTGDFSYHKDEKKTQSNRIGKYFTVGDVGLIDEDGYLFLRDRKIDMIISGGANIYPAEIENVLLGFPKVGDVAVFGIPHDDWGEEIKAVIEPAEGVEPTPELAAEILEYCSTRLAKFKTPKSIDFTDSMPRDPNGKLYKRKLRDPYWEGREKI
jgi:long-chain acyl-CoA synthetase